MTGMEAAIEQAARIIDPDAWRLRDGGGLPLDHPGAHAVVRKSLDIARALHAAGLLAPAPLREEWGSEMHDARPGSSSHVLYARDPENAQWQIDHNLEWATGRIVHRYVTDWLLVDKEEL